MCISYEGIMTLVLIESNSWQDYRLLLMVLTLLLVHFCEKDDIGTSVHQF